MRIPNETRLALLALVNATMASRAPDFVVGGGGIAYLQRWHLTPKGDGPALYAHRFLRSDDDRAQHDHPYTSTSVLLDGQYIEWLGERSYLRQQGFMVSRDAVSPHRVELLHTAEGVPLPVTTLFICGPRVREWGFHCPNGWRPWQEFVAERDAGAIGVGCG